MGSALDSASLIMYPSGYSDGVLGSAKPTDGSGDFTFTRGSNLSATRVGPNGYIEKGYENLLLQSNSFLTSPWGISSNAIVTSGYSGYDGTNDAWKAQFNGPFKEISQSVSTSGINTFSVYAKAGDTEWIRLTTLGPVNTRVFFNIPSDGNGSIGLKLDVVDASIEYISNGWYRCSVVVSGSISSVRIIGAIGNNNTNTNGEYCYIQDAMLNQGLVAYPYIETTTAPVAGGILEDEPRIDFSDGCGHLLLEPSRTNLMPYSEYFEDLSNPDLSSLDYNNALSPEGYVNAVKYTPKATTAYHRLFYQPVISVPKDYTISIFVKANGYNYFLFRISAGLGGFKNASFNLATGEKDYTSSTLTSTIEPYADDWYRVSVTINATTSPANIYFRPQPFSQTDDSIATYTGDGTSGCYIYGLQIEQDATYPTSYIPTYGVSQTRLKDNVSSLAGLDALNSAATIVAEFKVNSTGSVYYFQSTGGGSYVNISQYTQERLRMIVRFEGVNQVIGVVSDKIYPNTDYKLALRYDTNKADVFLNGEKVISETGTWTLEPLDELRWDFTEGNETKQVLVFPTALSDGECIALTTI